MRIHYLFFSIYSVINILSTHLVLCFFPPKSTWDKINVIFKRSHVSLRGIANHHSLYLFFLSLSLCINFILLCNSPCPNPQSSVLLVKVLHLPMKVSSIRCEVKVTQLCLTLCDLMDYTVHGILQARTLEWVAFPFSRGSSQPRSQTQVSHIAGGFFTS